MVEVLRISFPAPIGDRIGAQGLRVRADGDFGKLAEGWGGWSMRDGTGVGGGGVVDGNELVPVAGCDAEVRRGWGGWGSDAVAGHGDFSGLRCVVVIVRLSSVQVKWEPKG